MTLELSKLTAAIRHEVKSNNKIEAERFITHLVYFLKEKPGFNEKRFWKDCGYV